MEKVFLKLVNFILCNKVQQCNKVTAEDPMRQLLGSKADLCSVNKKPDVTGECKRTK